MISPRLSHESSGTESSDTEPSGSGAAGSRAWLVVGLGISGLAIARFLRQQGERFVMADTRAEPPGLGDFRARFPGVELHLGRLDSLALDTFDEIVVSPGIDMERSGLTPWRERVVGEIGLFTRYCHQPIVAITGSNAKSTVTTLVGEMAASAGLRVAVGGNLGAAALDLLIDSPDAELFVLELSSFQLETAPCLGAACAAFLNLSADHLDRHGDMAGYRAAKAAVFRGAKRAVVNDEDSATWPEASDLPTTSFTTAEPADRQWGIALRDQQAWLCCGSRDFMPLGALPLVGRHHQANALAAAAIGDSLQFPWRVMRQVLTDFQGLAHRGELVLECDGVRWINDSKGTNVGATLAALAGIGETLDGRLVWLGGGVGKGADFTALAEPLAIYAREAIVFGQDAQRLVAALSGHVPLQRVDTLHAAVQRAAEIARPGDCVLFSPACASFDQFPNYQVRGEAFRALLYQGQLDQGQDESC